MLRRAPEPAAGAAHRRRHASATKSYAELLTNPAAYEYQDLLNAAVTASRANKNADAAKLFEGVLQVNPYNRDALFNLAVTYLTLGQNEKVPPLVTRLVAVDPGNPENYLLAARAYVDIAKTRKGPAVAAAERHHGDLVQPGSQLPVEVTFSEMTPGEKSLEVAGHVLDRRDKAAAGGSGQHDHDDGRGACRGGEEGRSCRKAALAAEARDPQVRGARQERRGARLAERHHRGAAARQEREFRVRSLRRTRSRIATRSPTDLDAIRYARRVPADAEALRTFAGRDTPARNWRSRRERSAGFCLFSALRSS